LLTLFFTIGASIVKLLSYCPFFSIFPFPSGFSIDLSNLLLGYLLELFSRVFLVLFDITRRSRAQEREFPLPCDLLNVAGEVYAWGVVF